jgi:hypothetical protein
MSTKENYSKLLLFLWCGSITVVSITFLVIYYGITPGDGQAALHYNVILGVDLFGKGTELYKLPIIGFVITAINWLLAALLKIFDPVFQVVIASSTLVISFVLLLASLLLFTVN